MNPDRSPADRTSTLLRRLLVPAAPLFAAFALTFVAAVLFYTR